MKKIIAKKEYDTKTAALIKKHTYSYYGDPCGYEESLYQTTDGYYFLYCYGGENSQYPKEDIKRISKEKASAWLEAHS